MKQNIKVAKELIKLAKELSADTFFEKNHVKGEMEHVNGMEANELINHLRTYLNMLTSVEEQKNDFFNFHNQMKDLENNCQLVIDNYRQIKASKEKLSISNDQNKYQSLQNKYREMEKEAEELNDNLTSINIVMVRINKALRRYELCQMLMKQTGNEAESILSTFKQVYGEQFLDEDLKIKKEFEKFIKENNYEVILQESKHHTDIQFKDFIQELEDIKRIGQKLWDVLKIASKMTHAQQMYITTVKNNIRTIKAYVSNNSSYIQLLADKQKQIIEKKQKFKQSSIETWKDNIVKWIYNVFDKVKSFLSDLNNKIQTFFVENDKGLTELENKLTELEEKLK